MKIKIQIDCDNAAFDAPTDFEIARILREIADQAEDHGVDGIKVIIRDVNGNQVGTVVIVED